MPNSQMPMFDDVPTKVVWNRDEIVFSLSFDQTKILKDIMQLYNDGEPFDVDCTYSSGSFYRELPQPRLKFDIAPQGEDVIEASADKLPLENNSIGSLIFDPPFIPSISNVPGKIKKRFSSFKSLPEMWGLYELAMKEFWRVLKPNGILVIKCQDTVSSGENHFSHFEIEKYAREIGFVELDLFVLGNNHTMISSTWKVQRHARKNHSFFIVFAKPKRGAK